ncbi:beta/gamma crystallin domain-containing protein [Streptomyces sp. NPDC096080]|uniref:beta/gamma crystallin domain-containing protein n=1 Tax=Streptomyces sp. NPDC096080 TaxID=3156693 RepID=UPI00331A8E47
MTRTKTMASSAVAVIAAAAALTVAVPASNAYAINKVTCRAGEHFLKVVGHSEIGRSFTDCFANAGKYKYSPSVWVEKITAGNNDVVFYDVNGSTVSIKRGTVYKPTRAAHVKAIKIK